MLKDKVVVELLSHDANITKNDVAGYAPAAAIADPKLCGLL